MGSDPKQVQVYANQEEVEEMNKCHHPSVALLEPFLARFPLLEYHRALEVAAGDARLSRDLLRFRYRAIDCFDQCPVAVKKMERL